MTIDERAGKVCEAHFKNNTEPSGTFLRTLVKHAIDAAVDEEREACAVAVLDANHWFIENTGRTVSFAAQYAVSNGVEAIRARGAKRSAPSAAAGASPVAASSDTR